MAASAAQSQGVHPAIRHRRAHSNAAAPTMNATRTMNAAGGSRNRAASRAAIRTAAVAMRARSTPRSGKRRVSCHLCPVGLLDLLARASEAPLAAAVRRNGGIQGCAIEVRPQGFGEVELRIRQLPKEEVADALLAAGADKKVRLGRVAHREIRRQV